MKDDSTRMGWADVEKLFMRFPVWVGHPEMSWFNRAWASLAAEGLTSFHNDEERHIVLLRAIALLLMYGDYCELEWDEYTDDTSIAAELHHEGPFNHTRLGAMGAEWLSDEDSDEQSLFYSALLGLAQKRRLEVYDGIVKGLGDATLLCASLFASCSTTRSQRALEDFCATLFDDSGGQLAGRHEALRYVYSSMIGVDA